MTIGNIPDWHSIHNDDCPQNRCDGIDQDCTCEQRVKRHRNPDLINRSHIKKMLLQETNSRQNLRVFTQVYPSVLDEISALVKREIIRRAENPPRKGKSIR